MSCFSLFHDTITEKITLKTELTYTNKNNIKVTSYFIFIPFLKFHIIAYNYNKFSCMKKLLKNTSLMFIEFLK